MNDDKFRGLEAAGGRVRQAGTRDQRALDAEGTKGTRGSGAAVALWQAAE